MSRFVRLASRLRSAWRRCEDAVRDMLAPADLLEDEVVIGEVESSRIAAVGRRALIGFDAAWQTSTTGRSVAGWRSAFEACKRAVRVQLVCLTVAVAAAMHLLLLATATAWRTPLQWAVPVVVMVGALGVLFRNRLA